MFRRCPSIVYPAARNFGMREFSYLCIATWMVSRGHKGWLRDTDGPAIRLIDYARVVVRQHDIDW